MIKQHKKRSSSKKKKRTSPVYLLYIQTALNWWNCTSKARFNRNFEKKYSFIFNWKIAFTETSKTTQNEENMFTKKSKFKLFQIVFVAHDSNCDCFFFNQKYKSLIYKAIKVYYKQSQNYGTLFDAHHVSFLSHVRQDKTQHADSQPFWKFSKMDLESWHHTA